MRLALTLITFAFASALPLSAAAEKPAGACCPAAACKDAKACANCKDGKKCDQCAKQASEKPAEGKKDGKK